MLSESGGQIHSGPLILKDSFALLWVHLFGCTLERLGEITTVRDSLLCGCRDVFFDALYVVEIEI
jgi:hypothetical protein